MKKMVEKRSAKRIKIYKKEKQIAENIKLSNCENQL